MDALTLLKTRRSVAVTLMKEEAVSPEHLQEILAIATRVPDHGKLAPWRILILQADARAALGEVAAKRFAALYADAREAELAFERNRFCRAPLVLAVLSTPVIGKIPVIEQQHSASAVCMNILHAATALGLGAKWLTEWPAFDAEMTSHLLAQAGKEAGSIAGFIYIGHPKQKQEERERPDIQAVALPYRA